MIEIWQDREVELLKVLRPCMTSQEIQDVFNGLGFNRSKKSISKKGERLSVYFEKIDHPNLSHIDNEAKEIISEVISKRAPKEPYTYLPHEAHPEGHYLKGVSTLVNAQGSPILQWYKTSKEHESREEILKRLISEIPELVSTKQVPTQCLLKDHRNDILSVYPIGDPHIGMLAWSAESGEDFDHKIARSRLVGAMQYLINQSEPTENAIIINLGDFFHSDNSSNVTTRSKNSLDVDSRWAKILRVGLSVKIDMINLALRKHQNVNVIVEIGNHDDHTSIFLGIALDAYYKDEPRVHIDLSPAKFHYFQFGKNLIGVTHGDTVKPQDLESIMSCDKAKEWGESIYRYWYIGHIHHSRKWEFRGCTVESFRTLAPKDTWHSAHGYRSRCDMTKILLHKEYGEIFRSTIDSKLLKSLLEE